MKKFKAFLIQVLEWFLQRKDPMEWFEEKLEKYFPRLYSTYIDYNFCKGYNATGEEKSRSWFFDFFHKFFYLECACCAALRGIIFGCVLGWGARWVWTLVVA